MENENRPMENALIKGFGPKNVILLVLTVFAILVAYKYISSSIQENKEKAVIQERAKIQQQQEYEEKETKARLKSDLDSCLSMAVSDYDFNWAAKCKEYAKISADTIERCKKANFSNIVCESLNSPDTSSNCSLPSDWIDDLRDWLKERKSECFKKYPQ